MHRISMVGTGYVGLVTGACLADYGNEVICVDADRPKIDSLRAGRIPFYEFGLEELLERNVREKRLSFSTDIPEAIRQSDVIFVCVGTPRGSDGEADLQYVFQVARDIAKHLNGYKVGNPQVLPAAPGAMEASEDIPDEVDVLVVGCGPAIVKLDRKRVTGALAGAVPPGRLEVIPGKPLILLDGAHNAEGVEALVR